MALGESVKDILYIRNFFSEFGDFFTIDTPSAVHCDNMGAIFTASNDVNNKRTRHIDIRHHFIRELIEEFQTIEVVYISTEDEIADFFTKPLPKIPFNRFREMIGVIEFPSQ